MGGPAHFFSLPVTSRKLDISITFPSAASGALTLLHSQSPKLFRVLALLSAIGLICGSSIFIFVNSIMALCDRAWRGKRQCSAELVSYGSKELRFKWDFVDNYGYIRASDKKG